MAFAGYTGKARRWTDIGVYIAVEAFVDIAEILVEINVLVVL